MKFKVSEYLNPAARKIATDFSLAVSYRFGLKRLTARVKVSSVLVAEPSLSALPAYASSLYKRVMLRICPA